ncbi:sulfite oxidase [candidate division MSBL1 archaeon SCGC-AAA259E22]|uniref:Sulfite oxidase n=1 Tax=candidate division MSBL1 archaeon SCGC-AAA259E22 TaxID=1698265 RepID=A0A133UFX6_9EURY|nr:sulfite oxidase [candidate division MSBL1 archaeon SCGC-AAA259E22]
MSENFNPNSDSKKDRLPPGQKEIEEFPALSKGPVPQWPEDWKLQIFGTVKEEKRFTLSEIKKMPEVLTQRQDFHCVEGWSKLNLEWTGIRFKDLIGRVDVEKEAEHVLFHALDGYTTNLPLEVCLQDDILIAWKLNGEQIPPQHGGRVRTVVESKYAYKSTKWLSEIELLKEHKRGYWERRGYSDSADIWEENRFNK